MAQSTHSERSTPQPRLIPATTYAFTFVFPIQAGPPTSDTVQKPSNSRLRDELKHELRAKLTKALGSYFLTLIVYYSDLHALIIAGKFTRVPSAQMKWTAAGFCKDVAKKYEVMLKGWRDDIPFENLSNLPNAIERIQDLLDLLGRKELRFVKITRREAQALTPETASPGQYVPPRARAIRSDFKRHKIERKRPGRTLAGPKSDEFVYDSDEIEEFEDVPHGPHQNSAQ